MFGTIKKDLGWLFDAAGGWVAQVGAARMDKRALFWVPGKKKAACSEQPTFWGCTQLAFPVGTDFAVGPCRICWLGIDVDLDSALTHEQTLGLVRLGCSIRTSSGGNGVHLIWRLNRPVEVDYEASGRAVKGMLAERREQVARIVPVCSADRRMFWLWGGKNRWLHQTQERIEPSEHWQISGGRAGPDSAEIGEFVMGAGVRQWVEKMVADRVLSGTVGPSNRVHLGTVVPWLRSMGQIIATKSGLSASWHVNGHLDISENRLALYSYADSGFIWTWSDTDAILNGF